MRTHEKTTRGGRLQGLVTCFLIFAGFTVAVPLWAQNSNSQAPSPSGVTSSMQSGETKQAPLPDAPSASEKGSASISGAVLDPSGAAVSSADVTVTKVGESQGRTVMTATDGRFTLTDVPPGTYVILVKARGFQPAASAKFTVAADQTYEVPSVRLSIATATTEVVVQPTEVIAARQMKAEEKQRVFGVIPNFYTSYVWNAAPLDTKQKYSMAIRDTFDPVSFIGISFGAGIEQATDAFPGYGQA